MKEIFVQVFKVADEFVILKGTKAAEPKFREPLSELIIAQYGRGAYKTAVVTEILFFCQNYYISEFERICNNENSYTFYKEIVWLHEQATNLRQSEHFDNLPQGISKSYIAEYRRILKMIIEQGCCVNMISSEKRDSEFQKRIDSIINDLLFLGSMLILCAECIAEQTMIEDDIDITFDRNNLYSFSRRDHYDFIFQHLNYKQENDNPEYIIDNEGYSDFKNAVLNSFNIDYEKIWQVIILSMEHLNFKNGDCISFEREGFLKSIQNSTDASLNSIEKFLSGVTLMKNNKMPLSELIKKPHSLNRYLYRPILIWTINDKEYCVLGTYSFYETQNNLYLNAIPWGKIPDEWMDVKSFKNYMNKKEDAHDKWLDDVVEKDIKSTGLIYQRTVKKLIAKNKKTYSLEGKNIGEIDFIIISPNTKKVFIADCKHLQGRYDMVTQRQDYYKFTDDKSGISYNTRMNLKTQWLKEHKDILEEHFQLRFNEPTLSLKEYEIEGIFFINTPTFYIYNSDLRIYTFEQVIDVITGKHIDPIFSYYVNKEDSNIFYSIKYPYFRKPTMFYYEDKDEDCEVDKYGFPIKN